MNKQDAGLQAQTAYKTLCEMLDEIGWHYSKQEDKLQISSTASGDDLDIDIIIRVNPDLMVVALYSVMPFEVQESKRNEISFAVSVVNDMLVDGSFDYNYLSGKIIFRLTSSYRESLLGKELFKYMLMVSCRTVDDYNDRFLTVSKRNMDAKEIYDYMRED